MKLVPRNNFGGQKSIVIVFESEEESQLIDEYLSKTIPTKLVGEIELQDGYGEHYIELKVAQ